MAQWNITSVIKYMFFGGTAFAMDFALLWLFVSYFSLAPWFGAILAFVFATTYAFYTQKNYTFQSRALTQYALIRYLILWAANVTFTSVVVELFHHLFDLYLVGKVVTVVLTTLWNFPIMGRWVYAETNRDFDGH